MARKTAFLPSHHLSHCIPDLGGFTPLSHKQMYFQQHVHGVWDSQAIFASCNKQVWGITLLKSPS